MGKKQLNGLSVPAAVKCGKRKQLVMVKGMVNMILASKNTIILEGTIENEIYRAVLEYTPQEYIPLHALRVSLHNSRGLTLSHKQARDGLYRLRAKVPIVHLGQGVYKWDLQ